MLHASVLRFTFNDSHLPGDSRFTYNVFITFHVQTGAMCVLLTAGGLFHGGIIVPMWSFGFGVRICFLYRDGEGSGALVFFLINLKGRHRNGQQNRAEK